MKCRAALDASRTSGQDSWICGPVNDMYFDRIRRADGQEKERLEQGEIEEDTGPACGGPPKEDPPSRPLFRMVPRRRDEADHEHRRCGPGADRRARDGQRRVRPVGGARRPTFRSNLLLSGPAVRNPDMDHAGEIESWSRNRGIISSGSVVSGGNLAPSPRRTASMPAAWRPPVPPS